MADRAPSGGTEVPEAPAPLLVEQQMNSEDGPFVRRVAPDGSYWEYSASITTFEGGMMKTTPADPAWRRGGEQLTDEQVSRLTSLIDEQFFDLAAEYRPPGEVSDGFVVRWSACVGGRGHTVTLHSVDPADIDGLRQVRDAFELSLGEAAAEGEAGSGG